MKIAILGYGDRGSLYADLFTHNKATVAAVCDTDPKKLQRALDSNVVAKENCYDNEESFWAKGRLADLLVIATLDQLHYEQAIRAIKLGYDILLEKPIACEMKHCFEIAELAKKHGTKIYLCYVLRYAPFFMKVKEIIESGTIGKIATINLTEGVAYWHQAHSFVRGNWRATEEGSPMIVAKCCHDMDILYWLADSEPKNLSSTGNLLFFNEQNAPKNAAKHCCDCPLADDCVYNNYKFYSQNPWWLWKTGYFQGDYEDKEGIKNCLADKTNPYSRCVFYCDNDVVDHQVTNIEFENGLTAHLTMTAFTEDCDRRIFIHGTLGELYGNLEGNKLYYNVFGKEKTVIELAKLEGIEGHGGGDARMVKEIVDAYKQGRSLDKNGIDGAMGSHYLAFAAEESRKDEGKNIKMNEFKTLRG